jgi:hypothetical protein
MAQISIVILGAMAQYCAIFYLTYGPLFFTLKA